MPKKNWASTIFGLLGIITEPLRVSLWTVMSVYHNTTHTNGQQMVKSKSDKRLIKDGHKRLGPRLSERAKAGAESCPEHEGRRNAIVQPPAPLPRKSGFIFNKKAHRLHVTFDESVLEIKLPHFLGIVSEERDTQKIFLTSKPYGVF